MRKQFKETIMRLAENDERIAMIFGDVSVYLFKDFQDKYPQRFFNMGICENTLITVAAGMSSQGFVPFVHTINPFLTERSYEQIKLDVCYNRFGVNIVSCGGSFDYAWDGATHHCYTDMEILRLLPGMEVIQPGSKKELDALLRSQYGNEKPTYFRLSDHPHEIDIDNIQFGKAAVLREGASGLTVMTAGPILANVIDACQGLDINLVYFHTIKPIDTDTVTRFADTDILVIHDAFGLFEAITSAVPGISAEYRGLPDAFCGWYGTLQDIRARIGLDADSLRELVKSRISEKAHAV